jgi:hypothetical protein
VSDADVVATLAAERLADLRRQIDYLASTVALLPATPRRAAARAAVQTSTATSPSCSGTSAVTTPPPNQPTRWARSCGAVASAGMTGTRGKPSDYPQPIHIIGLVVLAMASTRTLNPAGCLLGAPLGGPGRSHCGHVARTKTPVLLPVPRGTPSWLGGSSRCAPGTGAASSGSPRGPSSTTGGATPVRPEHAAVELEQPARLFRWLFETSDIVAGGDEGVDALGAARELGRRGDLTSPRRVEDGVDTAGAGARTRSESPSP